MTTLTLQSVDALCKEHGWWKVAPVLPAEQAWIETLGKKRQANAKRRSLKSTASGDPELGNIAAVAGEWAVGLACNLPVRETSGTGTAGHQLPDVGSFLEVKTALGSTENIWNLCVNTSKVEKDAEDTIYVQTLYALYPAAMVIIGVCSRRRLIEKGITKHNLTHGNPFLLLPWKDLYPLDAFLKTDLWRNDVIRFGRAARQRES